MEEKFLGLQAAEVAVLNEAFALWAEIVL